MVGNIKEIFGKQRNKEKQLEILDIYGRNSSLEGKECIIVGNRWEIVGKYWEKVGYSWNQ